MHIQRQRDTFSWRFAAFNQEFVDNLKKEFFEWHKQQPKGSIFGGGMVGGLDYWPNIENFLKDKYPAAHQGFDMGYEQAGTTLDHYPVVGGREYETGPEAMAQYGYDPKEIAAGMLLLHNKTDRFRGDLEEQDQQRLVDIFNKRQQMQREYEKRQNTAAHRTAAPIWQKIPYNKFKRVVRNLQKTSPVSNDEDFDDEIEYASLSNKQLSKPSVGAFPEERYIHLTMDKDNYKPESPVFLDKSRTYVDRKGEEHRYYSPHEINPIPRSPLTGESFYRFPYTWDEEKEKWVGDPNEERGRPKWTGHGWIDPETGRGVVPYDPERENGLQRESLGLDYTGPENCELCRMVAPQYKEQAHARHDSTPRRYFAPIFRSTYVNVDDFLAGKPSRTPEMGSNDVSLSKDEPSGGDQLPLGFPAERNPSFRSRDSIWEHPDLGRMLLDHIALPKDPVRGGGLGRHYTTDPEIARQLVPPIPEHMRDQHNYVPVIMRGMWGGRGENPDMPGMGYSLDEKGNKIPWEEDEVNLIPKAQFIPTHVYTIPPGETEFRNVLSLPDQHQIREAQHTLSQAAHITASYRTAADHGGWYHVTHQKLSPGDRITPGGGGSRWTDDNAYADRGNHVWLSDDDDHVGYWLAQFQKGLGANGLPNLYEVHPDQPPTLYDENDPLAGHVTSGATVVQQHDPHDFMPWLDGHHTAHRTAMPRHLATQIHRGMGVPKSFFQDKSGEEIINYLHQVGGLGRSWATEHRNALGIAINKRGGSPDDPHVPVVLSAEWDGAEPDYRGPWGGGEELALKPGTQLRVTSFQVQHEPAGAWKEMLSRPVSGITAHRTAMPSRTVPVGTQGGLHTRPSSIITDAVLHANMTGNPGKVTLQMEGQSPVDASSFFEVMNLGALRGTPITVSSDNEALMRQVADIVAHDHDTDKSYYNRFPPLAFDQMYDEDEF